MKIFVDFKLILLMCLIIQTYGAETKEITLYATLQRILNLTKLIDILLTEHRGWKILLLSKQVTNPYSSIYNLYYKNVHHVTIQNQYRADFITFQKPASHFFFSIIFRKKLHSIYLFRKMVQKKIIFLSYIKICIFFSLWVGADPTGLF